MEMYCNSTAVKINDYLTLDISVDHLNHVLQEHPVIHRLNKGF